MRVYTPNTQYFADCVDVVYPRTIAELQTIVRDARAAGRGIRVQGNGYINNPTSLADDGGVIIRTAHLEKSIRLVNNDLVEVAGGVDIDELNCFLTEHGKQVPVPTLFPVFKVLSLAVVPYVASHPRGCFWSQNVAGYTVVTADGDLLEIGEEHELLPFLRTSMGVLGIAVKVLVRVLPQAQYHRTYRLISRAAVLEMGSRAAAYEGFFLPNARIALVWEEEIGEPSARVRHSVLHDALFEFALWPFLGLRRLGRAKKLLNLGLRLSTWVCEKLRLKLRLPYDPNFRTVIGFARPTGYLVRDGTFNPIALRPEEYAQGFDVVDEIARRHAPFFDTLILVGTVQESPLSPMYNSSLGSRPFFELFPIMDRRRSGIARANEMQLELSAALAHTGYLSTLHHGHQYHPTERLFGPRGPETRARFLELLRRHDPDGLFMNNAMRHAFGLPVKHAAGHPGSGPTGGHRS